VLIDYTFLPLIKYRLNIFHAIKTSMY